MKARINRLEVDNSDINSTSVNKGQLKNVDIKMLKLSFFYQKKS